MANITAALVKELRGRSSAGMMDCKKALVENDGDIERAYQWLREKGQAKADKKANRVASEGLVIVNANHERNQAIILEVNSETDFVARDDNFRGFVDSLAQTALASQIDDVDALANQTLVGQTHTVEDARRELIAKIGENIQIRRLTLINADGPIGRYVHGDRIGVLVELKGGDTELAKGVAMHIAASNPLVVKSDDVPEEVLAQEREVFTAQARESGKPDDIIEKMIVGRMRKFVDEISLLGQPYVKDPSMTVAQMLKSANADVVQFIRYEVGEGIEKEEQDFAAEVKAQVEGSA